MPKLYISALLWIFMLTASAQQPILHWAKTFPSNNVNNYRVSNNGRTVGVDAQGNVYSAGLFEYAVDFDPGPGVFSLTGGTGGLGISSHGIYISKLDANGNFVWACQVPTLVEFGQIELKLDKAGNVYLTSDLNDPADMDPGSGKSIMTPIGFRDAFVIKLDGNGNFLWAKQFGGPGDTGPQANALAIDQDNNVIIGGQFNNTVDFDPGPGTFNLTSTAHFQSFLVKLNSNGDFIWAKQFGNSPSVYSGAGIKDIEIDRQGKIVLTGGFSGTCDFDPGTAVNSLTSTSGSFSDGYICKLDADCNFVWVKAIGQTGGYNHFLFPTGIDIDGMNNIVTTGYFIGNFDFDPGPAVHNTMSNPTDCYILKLDAQGNYVWSKTIGGTEGDTGNDIVTDASSNVYVTGSFGTSVDFDPGPGVFIINSPFYGASAVIKLNSAGNFLYAVPFQNINYGSSLFRRMVVDTIHNIYVTGSIGGTVDFDPGPDEYPLSSSSDGNPFVVKLGPCLNSTRSTLDINSCSSYTINNQTYDSSGTYELTVANASGCDSVITLNLTINKRRTEQIISICDGQFFHAGGSDKTTSGIYYDTLKTVLGCDSVVVTNLMVNPRPVIDLGPDQNLCRNSPLALSAGTYNSYLWQDSSTAAAFTINKAGVYWVKVSNNFHCTATDTFTVKAMLEPPSNFLKKTDSICSYETLDLLPFHSYTDYLWSTGITDKNIQVKQPGTYRLSVTDVNGCKGTDSTTIFAKNCIEGIYVPNAFTPNADGTNDLFKPIIYGNVLQYKFTVHNRWGAIVFESNNPAQGWNGTLKGITQDPAVFSWTLMCRLAGQTARYEKGIVILLR